MSKYITVDLRLLRGISCDHVSLEIAQTLLLKFDF